MKPTRAKRWQRTRRGEQWARGEERGTGGREGSCDGRPRSEGQGLKGEGAEGRRRGDGAKAATEKDEARKEAKRIKRVAQKERRKGKLAAGRATLVALAEFQPVAKAQGSWFNVKQVLIRCCLTVQSGRCSALLNSSIQQVFSC